MINKIRKKPRHSKDERNKFFFIIGITACWATPGEALCHWLDWIWRMRSNEEDPAADGPPSLFRGANTSSSCNWQQTNRLSAWCESRYKISRLGNFKFLCQKVENSLADPVGDLLGRYWRFLKNAYRKCSYKKEILIFLKWDTQWQQQQQQG